MVLALAVAESVRAAHLHNALVCLIVMVVAGLLAWAFGAAELGSLALMMALLALVMLGYMIDSLVYAL